MCSRHFSWVLYFGVFFIKNKLWEWGICDYHECLIHLPRKTKGVDSSSLCVNAYLYQTPSYFTSRWLATRDYKAHMNKRGFGIANSNLKLFYHFMQTWNIWKSIEQITQTLKLRYARYMGTRKWDYIPQFQHCLGPSLDKKNI